MEVLIILSIIVAAPAIRLIAVRHASTDFDTYGHLYYAKEVKAQKSGPFGEFVPRRVIGATGFRHPFLWHWLIGLFGITRVLRYQKWINPTLDALFAVLLYGITRHLGYSSLTAGLATFLYLLTPMWFSRLSIGPRVSSLTPRLVSELGVNLFFIVVLLPLGLPLWVTLVLGTILGACVLLVSKFGLQVLLFLAPTTALFAWDLKPFAALIMSVLLSLLVTRGDYLRTARQQLHHLVWYFRKNLQGDMTVSGRNDLSVLSNAWSSKSGLRRKVQSVLGTAMVFNSFVSVLTKMPVLPVALALCAVLYLQGQQQVDGAVVAPVIAASVAFLLTSWSPLLFLGEAERYLSHVAYAIVLSCVLAAHALDATWMVWLLIAYGAAFWLVESLLLQRLLPQDSVKRIPENNALLAFLSSFEGGASVLSYPYHAGPGVFRILVETDSRVIYPLFLKAEALARFEARFGAKYPFVRLERLDEMAKEFGINVVIVEQAELERQGLGDWAPSRDWTPVKIGTCRLRVYRRV